VSHAGRSNRQDGCACRRTGSRRARLDRLRVNGELVNGELVNCGLDDFDLTTEREAWDYLRCPWQLVRCEWTATQLAR
jgi:hypothetical protein